MEQLKLDMPLVSKCNASQCAYNKEQQCHAKAITIGDAENPGCDTFFSSSAHSKRISTAGVGACKVGSCQFNEDFECMADAIEVGKKSGKIKCLTFKSKA